MGSAGKVVPLHRCFSFGIRENRKDNVFVSYICREVCFRWLYHNKVTGETLERKVNFIVGVIKSLWACKAYAVLAIEYVSK